MKYNSSSKSCAAKNYGNIHTMNLIHYSCHVTPGRGCQIDVNCLEFHICIQQFQLLCKIFDIKYTLDKQSNSLCNIILFSFRMIHSSKIDMSKK